MFVKTKNYWPIWTRIACVLALLSLGFAHQSPALSKDTTIDLSAYLLPDGTLPVFCLSNNGSSNGIAQYGHCEACRLSASVDIPFVPTVAIAFAAPILLARNNAIQNLTFQQVFPPSAPPRAPPDSRI